jgi:hypothetical protein
MMTPHQDQNEGVLLFSLLVKTQRLRVTKRRESIVNVERRVPIVMGTDRCTMTSERWYRNHAERGGRETDSALEDKSKFERTAQN